MLLLKGSFERKEIIFYEKNLKHKKLMHLTNFIFTRTFFLSLHTKFEKLNKLLPSFFKIWYEAIRKKVRQK